jgi:TRAP transporter 4TM/12TM fusion protein
MPSSIDNRMRKTPNLSNEAYEKEAHNQGASESDRSPRGDLFSIFIKLIAISFSIFQFYTAYFLIPTMHLRTIHVLFGFVLTFLTYPLWGKAQNRTYRWVGAAESIIIVIITYYVLSHYQERAFSIGLAAPFTEIALGFILILLAIDACRRVTGWIFPIITILSLLYALFGSHLPVLIAHKSYSLTRIVDSTFLTTDGVYGSLVGVSARYIYLFVLFGTFLNESGGGVFFIKLANSLMGRYKGGPAKTSVIASSLFGMISGSGMANVASVGQITIPLMIRTGYRPQFAAAVETVSSAGGLIMPPVMGMASFIMMEILGVSYLAIIRSAILIAILYYLGVFMMVHLEAAKTHLTGLTEKEIPRFGQTIKEGWPFLVPPSILVILLAFVGLSVTMSAFWAIISIPCSTFLTKSTRITFRKIVSAFENSAYNALPIVVVVSLAGVAVGMVSLTGLGLRLTSIIISLSGGHLFSLLLLAMAATTILGMGLPTVAAYIITAVLVVPALTEYNIHPFVAHMFIFYFSSMAGITPPMAPFAFVAAGIAKSPIMTTALIASKLALVIYVIPFIFIYNPSLLLIGNPLDILIIIVTSILSVLILSCALEGYLLERLSPFKRVYFFIMGFLLISPYPYAKLAGLGLLGIFIFLDKKTVSSILRIFVR